MTLAAPHQQPPPPHALACCTASSLAGGAHVCDIQMFIMQTVHSQWPPAAGQSDRFFDDGGAPPSRRAPPRAQHRWPQATPAQAKRTRNQRLPFSCKHHTSTPGRVLLCCCVGIAGTLHGSSLAQFGQDYKTANQCLVPCADTCTSHTQINRVTQSQPDQGDGGIELLCFCCRPRWR